MLVEDQDGSSSSASMELFKKSNSTGFLKLWRFRDLVHRSNNDGKERGLAYGTGAVWFKPLHVFIYFFDICHCLQQLMQVCVQEILVLQIISKLTFVLNKKISFFFIYFLIIKF